MGAPYADTPLVCFDNDGTLFASHEVANPAIRRQFVRFVRAHGLDLPAPTDKEILGLTGTPGPVFYREILPPSLREHASEFRRLCLEEEVREVSARGRFFDGAESLLRDLRAAGRRLCLVSNGGTLYIDAVSRRLGYETLLDGVYHHGRDGLETKAGMIRAAMHDQGERRAVMIGDRASDLEAAREVGVPFIACRFGYASPGELEGVEESVDSLEELRPLLIGDHT
jgi:phosphoglycolate phosphatase